MDNNNKSMNRTADVFCTHPLLPHLHSGIHHWMELAREFSRLGVCGVPGLIQMITSGREDPLPAIWALGEIGDRRAIPYLMQILGNGRSSCIRAAAAVALLKIDDPEGIRMVHRYYGTRERNV